jgi:uncharacterized membrane protein YhaH (DUF805 family)
MPDENLLKYIRDGLAQGRTEDILRPMLASAGWAQKDVDDAFNFVKTGQISMPVSSMPIQPVAPVSQAFKSNGSTTIITSGNPLKDSSHAIFFSWKGRIGRLRFLISVVGLAIIATIVSYGIFFLPSFGGIVDFILIFFGPVIIGILLIVINSMFCIQRFHDLNKSGWYYLGLIVPIFNVYLFLGLLLQTGTEGTNQYGGDPLPASANHNDFLNRFGSSVVFKIVAAILLGVAFLAISFYGDLREKQSQQTTLQNVDQGIVQNAINSLAASSTNEISSTPSVAPSQTTQPVSTKTPTPPPTPTSPATVTPSSNQSGIDTSSWQTESIHFAPFSICWTIKYPLALFPVGANNGYSSDEEFVSSQTLTPQTTGVTLAADFNETYSSVASGQTFTTGSGLNGSIATDSSGSWRIFIQASEGGKDFVLVLNPYSGDDTPPYDINTAEAMAQSVTLSCSLPASPQ